MKLSLATVGICALAGSANAFSGMKSNTDISRRESFANAASIIGGVAGIASLPGQALAVPTDETPRVISRLGGLLVSS